MDWSGTTPIPDGDRVEPLSDELRATLRAERVPPPESIFDSNWIVMVGIALCLIPFVVWLFIH